MFYSFLSKLGLILILFFCLFTQAYCIPPEPLIKVTFSETKIVEIDSNQVPTKFRTSIHIKQKNKWAHSLKVQASITKLDNLSAPKKKAWEKIYPIGGDYSENIEMPVSGMGNYKIEVIVNGLYEEKMIPFDKDYIYVIIDQAGKLKIMEYPGFLQHLQKTKEREIEEEHKVSVLESIPPQGNERRALTEATINGVVSFRNTGNPASSVLVEIWDDKGLWQSLLESQYTNHNGSFSFKVNTWIGRSLYIIVKLQNDDLIFREYRTAKTKTEAIPNGVGDYMLISTMDEGEFIWKMRDRISVPIWSSRTETISPNKLQASFYKSDHKEISTTWELAHNAEDFLSAKGGKNPGIVNVCFDVKNEDAYYQPRTNTIAIGENHIEDGFVIAHEYGHAVMDMAQKHTHPGNTCPSPHYIDREVDLNCAWTEGWANFYGLCVTRDPIAHSYGIDFELFRCNILHGGCEGRVAAALWDLYDFPNDGNERDLFRGKNGYRDDNQNNTVNFRTLMNAFWGHKYNTFRDFYNQLSPTLTDEQRNTGHDILEYNYIYDNPEN